jgi:hypothetical protein
MSAVRNYILVTLAYWAFTLTDGALRMLVLLHFHGLGYSPVDLAFLFLFYEFFGVVTNLLGGYIAARLGLRVTLFSGLLLQVAGAGDAVPPGAGLVEGRVRGLRHVGAQALSGIAKDLTKMSSKSSIKVLVPEDQTRRSSSGWPCSPARRTRSRARASSWAGCCSPCWASVSRCGPWPARCCSCWWAACSPSRRDMGRSKGKAKFTTILSKTRAINVLSAARFFLFGARDIWFVVGVPVFLSVRLEWGFTRGGRVPGGCGSSATAPSSLQRPL